MPQELHRIVPDRSRDWGYPPMDNASQGVHNLSIEQQIKTDQVSLAQLALLIVKAGVARGDRLQRVVEVAPKLSQWQHIPAKECQIPFNNVPPTHTIRRKITCSDTGKLYLWCSKLFGQRAENSKMDWILPNI